MFGKQMIALQTRKEALLLESDLNRLRLRAEINNLREAANLPKKLRRLGQLGGIASALAPLAGIIATFGPGPTTLIGGLLRKALLAAPPMIRLWRTVSALLAEFR